MGINKRLNLGVLISIIAGLIACGEDEGGEDVDFDRALLLDNIGDNVIMPGYTSLQVQVDDLQTQVLAFTTEPTIESLVSVKSAFEKAYLGWQSVSFYEFGPAFDISLRSALNTFPSTVAEIERNITDGGYNLDAVPNLDAKGFPALDYLLYSQSDTETIARFEEDNKAVTYIQDVVDNMKVKVDAVVMAWSEDGDNYLSTFTDRVGTDVGSSVGLLVNEMNEHYEVNTRDKKIGIPLGVRSLGVPLPDDVEARFSQNSIALAIANLQGLKQLYTGGTDNSAIGFDDYLKEINAGQGVLHTDITSQFDEAIKAVGLIGEPYSEIVSADATNANEAYAELQKLVILLKADMPSALGVLITYQDNDGD